jgi:hypothetical protein
MPRRKTSAVVSPLSRTRARLNGGQAGFLMRTKTGRRVVMLDGSAIARSFLLAVVQIPECRDTSRSVCRQVPRVNTVACAAVDRPWGQLTTLVGRRLVGVSVLP